MTRPAVSRLLPAALLGLGLSVAAGLSQGLTACGGEGAGSGGGDGDRRRKADVAEMNRIPDVAVEDLDGASHPLRELIRGPTVVNFWATWCHPCKRELPELVEVDDSLRGDGGRVLGIAVSSGSASEIRAFAEEHGVDFPVYRADGTWAGEHFDLYGLPTTLLVDGDGRVHRRLLGAQTRESLMEHLAPLLDED